MSGAGGGARSSACAALSRRMLPPARPKISVRPAAGSSAGSRSNHRARKAGVWRPHRTPSARPPQPVRRMGARLRMQTPSPSSTRNRLR
eukprot:scaffold6731_cov202-Prasinococcus_capsulatus_cf.AAC.1